MYIESVPNRSSPPAILLRESFRDGGRVKKRTLANLSKLPTAAINAIRRILRGERLVNPDDAFACLRSLPHGHVAAVLATVRKLALPALLARSPGRLRDLVLALLVARVIDAQSKLATARALTPESAVSTLGEMLDLGTVDPKELYTAMDWLVERQSAIEQRLAKRHLQEHTLVLYDLTSSYVEGTHCELAQRGHSRDRKKGTLQIVFGLLCTATGCPVAVEVFEGSTSDPNTVAAQVDKIRTRFGLHRVVLVGDRGMLTAARIREDLAEVDGLRWITTLRAPTIRKLVAAGTVSASLFDQRDLAEVSSEEFPGERLIVCRNPLLAAERQRKRQELLAATEKELEPIVDAGPPPSACASARSSTTTGFGRVLLVPAQRSRDRRGTATRRALHRPFQRRAGTVRCRADGARLQGPGEGRARLSVPQDGRPEGAADPPPPRRPCAHVLLCMLAYYVEWHMRQALKPLLFGLPNNSAPPWSRRPSSPAARAKVGKRTATTYPCTLQARRGTLTANTMRVADGDATFTMLTEPTPVQRSFELLGATPRM